MVDAIRRLHSLTVFWLVSALGAQEGSRAVGFRDQTATLLFPPNRSRVFRILTRVQDGDRKVREVRLDQ